MHFSHAYIAVTKRPRTLKLETFLSKKLTMCFLISSSSPLKNQGLNSFPFGENWKLLKKFSITAIHCTHIVFWISLQRKEIDSSNFQTGLWWEIFSGLILCKCPMRTCAHLGSAFIDTWGNSIIYKMFPSRLNIY